jgi:outer membrane protein assembly factor BamB
LILDKSYVSATDGTALAPDANTGDTRWNYTTSGVVEGTPTVANEVVYVGSHNHSVPLLILLIVVNIYLLFKIPAITSSIF